MKLFFKITIPLFLFITILIISLYYPLFNGTKIIQEKFKNGFIANYNGEVFKPFPEADKSDRFDKIWTFNVNYNAINPIITYVTFKNNPKTSVAYNYNYIQFRLKKISLTDFEVQKVTYAFVIGTNPTEEQILKYAQYDFDQLNPNSSFIRIDPAPTREEVERVKQIDDREKKLENNPAYKQGIQDCINKYSAPGTGPEQDKCFSELQSKLLN